MKAHVLIALAAAAFAWPLAANDVPAAQRPGADWSHSASIQAGAMTVFYPRAWTASAQESTIVLEAGGTRILLADYGPVQADTFPARPGHFALDDDDHRFLSCLSFEGWNVTFADRGRALQAFVELGPGIGRPDAAEVLDRLVIS
jgi:hypothetical protein